MIGWIGLVMRNVERTTGRRSLHRLVRPLGWFYNLKPCASSTRIRADRLRESAADDADEANITQALRRTVAQCLTRNCNGGDRVGTPYDEWIVLSAICALLRPVEQTLLQLACEARVIISRTRRNGVAVSAVGAAEQELSVPELLRPSLIFWESRGEHRCCCPESRRNDDTASHGPNENKLSDRWRERALRISRTLS